MQIETMRPGTLCNCESEGHNCVLITDRHGVTADQVEEFARENNATCCGDIIIRFPSCHQDIVSKEGLQEALDA